MQINDYFWKFVFEEINIVIYSEIIFTNFNFDKNLNFICM